MSARGLFPALLGVVVVAGAAFTGVTSAQEPAGPLSLTLIPAPPPSCNVSGGPNVALCLGPATSELQALRKLACLLDALNRWRLQVIACAQRQVDDWQARVIWPRAGRRTISTGLARVRTLREEAEALAESDWELGDEEAALASIYTSPERVGRSSYEAAWGASTGAGRDVQDLLAWHSAHTRNVIQARTSAAFGLAGELPETSWERIGREGARIVGASQTDALSALRFTPQMIADRLRVDASTTRLQAQALVTGQLLRDYRRLRRDREQHLGTLMLGTLTRPVRER